MLVAMSAAVGAAGLRARVFRTEWVTYAIGPDAMVVIVDAGIRPGADTVEGRKYLSLISPFPFREKEWRDDVPTLAFARLSDGCAPLGLIRPALDPFANSGRARIRHWDFVEPLSFETWDLVRGVSLDEFGAGWGDLRWLDLVPHDRVAAMEAFIAGWYADVPRLPNGPVLSDPRVPAPLLALYLAVAGRPELLDGQDQIFTSDKLESDGPDDWIVFGAENQGAFQWVMDPTEPDPAVAYTDEWHPPEPEPMSGFLLQFCLAEAALRGPVKAYAEVDPAEVASLTDRLRPVPLLPAGWCGAGTFHVAPGLVVMVGDGLLDPAKKSISMSGRHPSFFWPRYEVGLPWKDRDH